MRRLTICALLAACAARSMAQDRRIAAPVRLEMEFVKIPPGEFIMGCSALDNQCFENEKPAHRVRITKAFEIGKYEVTQAQWESVMGSNPSYFEGTDQPVEQVSWSDAQQFLEKMNGRHDGYRYRLPTEAEWEYAARGPTTGAEAGSLDAIAWYDTNSGRQTHPVGQKQPNASGLYDMLGNVWEWVQDWYGNYISAEQVDPTGPSSGTDRVLRGGSWYNRAEYSRVSFRYSYEPSVIYVNFGFRCVRQAIP